jgi:hypothetical protein
MAPSYLDRIYDNTQLTWGGHDCSIPIYKNTQSNGTHSTLKTETKKEKIARIAKELMLASWKDYNDRTVTVKEVNFIGKPKYRFNYK